MKTFPDVKQTRLYSLLLAITLLVTQHTWAQCPNDNSPVNTIPFSLTCGTGSETIATGVSGGQYVAMNVVAGSEYTFETCGLSDSGFDTEMTIYEDDGTFIDHNDDDCGTDSRITFTPNATGVIRILIDVSGCTSNTAETGIVASCTTAPCDITSVSFTNVGDCNDNGTPNDPNDDFFTANVVINFINPPATGSLQIVPGGDAIGTTSIPVSGLFGNNHTFTNVQFKADGTPTDIEVAFTDPANPCVLAATGPLVFPCSCTIAANFSGNVGSCNDNGTPNDPSDDFFLANVRVIFANRPFTGFLQIVPGGDQLGTYQVAVNATSGNQHIFNNVMFKADGTPSEAQVNFTDQPGCIATVTGTANVPACSANAPSCEIIGYSFANIGPCNDNGTPNDDTDDFFEVDVDVIYSNSAPFQTLFINGTDVISGGSTTAQIGTNLTQTFTDLRFRADGQITEFTGAIQDGIANIICSLPGTGPAVNACSNSGPPCEIIGFSFANIGSCNDNGTPSNDADDFFTVDIDVLFSNSVSGVNLTLSFPGPFPNQTFPNVPIGTNLTHTFTGVHLIANGQPASLNAEIGVLGFPSCSLPGTGPAVNSCSISIPPNDACANAIPLQCNTSVDGTIIGATVEIVPNCTNFGVGSPGVWYSFVGNGQIARLTGCGSNTDAGNQISIFTGGCGNLTCVSTTFTAIPCNGFSVHSHHFPTVAGTTYLVLVRGANSAFFGDFTLTLQCANPFPPDGAATVSCASNAVTPTPPTYSTGFCQPDLPIVPTLFSVTQNPNPVTCEGTITYEYNYLDCNFILQKWHFVYTIERQPFTVPANGASTVACPNLAGIPIPPTVTSNCGETLVPTGPVITDNPATITCEGTSTFTFTFTDCEGNTAQWSHVTTIERQPFTITTPNGATTVNCPANLPATVTPPVVTSNCGEVLTPTGPVITNTPATITCEGTRTFTFTYTDCEGNTAQWSHVFTVERQPFTVPANGASTVACPSQIVQPTPPTVLSNCGEVLTPTGPVIVNSPNPITCEGTRTFTFTFTDCEGNTAQWSHVTTVERQPFTVPANGSATVACPDQTDVQPTPPLVTSNCGEVLVPVITVSAKPGCQGDRAYVFHYTDCEGNTADWQFTYHVVYQDFTVPASEVLTVNCPIEATQPVPPVILDNCGRPVNMSGPVVSHTENAGGCEASRKYEWTFQDCAGHTHTWSKTFLFQYGGDFFTYPDQTDYVSCLLYAQPPVPPTIYDFCGNEIVVTGPFVEESIESGGCAGWRKFTFVYTDCNGTSHPWVFTTFANDDQPPVGDCVSGTVDVTSLSCIEEVPCPEDFDFSGKITEMLTAGHIYDLCSGNDVTVELDSWSDLWQCSDPDGDGVGTFGRTFYFRIADQCGNEMPSLCSVTYSGACQPLQTFTQGDWGNAGDEPAASTPTAVNGDLQIIAELLGQGPLLIGGSHRSITLTDAQCAVNLLPGVGYPTVLGNCQQVNCTGCNPAGTIGMKNMLAANAIALTLNLRYNQHFNGISLNGVRNQALDCIALDPAIVHCDENGMNCELRIFESNGTMHELPLTIGGLLDLTNLFLDGNLSLTDSWKTVYAAALNQALQNVNNYWHPGSLHTACDANAGTASLVDNGSNKALPNLSKQGISLRIVPNPANRWVTLSLSDLSDSESVEWSIYNAFGQRMMHREYANVGMMEEQLDISALQSGIYVVIVNVGGRWYEQKLMVDRE